MTVTVLETPKNNVGAFSGINDITTFFADYWVWMIICLVLIIVAGILWYVIKRMQDDAKLKEDVVYKSYLNILDSCMENSNKLWIRKKWNPTSLLLLLIPVIGWVFIPFIKKERSAKIRDIDGNLKGYYRGHSKLSTGDIALLYYNTKEFIFFEKKKILIIPTSIKVKQGKNDSFKNIDSYYLNKNTGEWTIRAVGFERRGTYFFYPTLISDNGVIPLEKHITQSLKHYTGYEIIENLTTDFSRQMREAVNMSATVRGSQEMKEPVKNLGDHDGE